MRHKGCLPALVFLALAASSSCGGPRQATVELVDGKTGPLDLRLVSMTGSRDGERLSAQAQFAGESGKLAMEMQFAVGVPTEFTSGRFSFETEGRLEEGSILGRSITFLGGQSDPPSIGGVFTLISDAGVPRYQVVLPTAQLARP